MATPNSQYIWKLMTNHKFELDPDSIHEDMFCIICKNLMKDACHSVCGCQYCYQCIAQYIGSEEKYCPGNKSSCKDEFLCIDRDVIRDMRKNNKIFKAKVVCPNELCDFKIELAQIDDHLRVCGKQSIECPFVIIGCRNEINIKNNILSHLDDDNLNHSQILLEFINNMKNEVNELTTALGLSKVQIEFLKEELKQKDTQMIEQKKEMVLLMMEQKNEMAMLEKKLMNTLELGLCPMMKDVEILKSDTIDQREEIDFLMNGGWTKRMVSIQSCGLEGKIEDKIKIINDDRLRRMNSWLKWNKLCPDFDADFVWRISDWNSKRETMRKTDIFSDSFYSHNYKFCLNLYIYNDDSIWLCCQIMKGDNDEMVEWPMNLSITLGILDQETLRMHNRCTKQYDTYGIARGNRFDKPKNDLNNDGIGTYSIIKHSSIKDMPSIIVDDSIIVSCVIGGQ